MPPQPTALKDPMTGMEASVHQLVALMSSAGTAGVLGEVGKGLNQGHWLALILMVTGALVLRHALRMRKDKDEFSRPPFKPAAPDAAISGGSHTPGTSQTAEDLHRVVREAQHVRRVLADESDRHAARLEELVTRAEQAIQRLETLSQSDAAAARSLDRSDGVDPLNRRIYELADQGLPPVDIARNLNQHTGKVELVLALRPR